MEVAIAIAVLVWAILVLLVLGGIMNRLTRLDLSRQQEMNDIEWVVRRERAIRREHTSYDERASYDERE